MKDWARKLTVMSCAALLFGCAGIDRALADRKATLTQKQSDYKTGAELATKYLTLSGDKHDSFRDMVVSGRNGLPIEIPFNPNGSGAFIERGGARALPVSFECDYHKGETRGELTLSYQDPRNLYGRIYAVVEVKCIPLNPEEQAAQVRREVEAAKVAEENRLAEEQAQAQLEAQRKERERLLAEKERERQAKEAREQAIRNSPQFKRNEAQQNIKLLRQQIEQAQRRMDEERRVGLVSGYVNASKLHELGSFIVGAESEIQRQWQIYKSNGGQ
jgi:hypothetical protein